MQHLITFHMMIVMDQQADRQKEDFTS